jgi:hypothetical protein
VRNLHSLTFFIIILERPDVSVAAPFCILLTGWTSGGGQLEDWYGGIEISLQFDSTMFVENPGVL